MKFTDLDKKMRVYETEHDQRVLPGVYIVARIDGRCFTTLTRENHEFEAPYDERFRDLMVATTEHLMQCGFKVQYAYTQSDEINLLFDSGESTFERKERKLNSILAGEASAKFSLLLGDMAVFDCRICQLPNSGVVSDYFRWRSEDANRNALNAHCYWNARKTGASASEATALFSGKSVAQKNEYLFQNGINFNDLPSWQKRGIALYWERIEKEAINPKTGAATLSSRRSLKVDLELPMREQYSEFVSQFIQAN